MEKTTADILRDNLVVLKNLVLIMGWLIQQFVKIIFLIVILTSC